MKLNIEHCTTNIEYGAIYFGERTVIVQAEDGYYFPEVPYISYYAEGSGSDHAFIYLESTETTEHKTTFQCVFNFNTQDKDATLNAHATVKPESVNKYGIINVYNPSISELKQIGEARYIVAAGSNSGTLDLGAYIASLFKVFVNVPKGERAFVTLGGFTTKVESNVVKDDIVDTDCGEVEIKGKYQNSMDYNNTEIEIYLPFIGFRTLDASKVMDKVLKLIYKVNLLNGDGMACLYDTDGTLIYTFDCTVSFNIPYKMSGFIDDRSTLALNANYLHGFTPFITVRYNKEYNILEDRAGDNRLITVNDYRGFLACEDVYNTIVASTEERDLIDKALKSGIIIDDPVADPRPDSWY